MPVYDIQSMYSAMVQQLTNMVYTNIEHYKHVHTCIYISANLYTRTSRTNTQMKRLRGVQNELFTFEMDTESVIVDCTLER